MRLRNIPLLNSAAGWARELRERRRRGHLAARALPTMVAVELTNVCNLRCAKCPLSRTKRPRGFLDETLFGKVLHDVESSGGSTEIALSGAGEPTLHPGVVDFVRAAREIPNVGVIGFATNGVELTPDLSEALLDAGLTRLKASLDAEDAARYLRFNGVDAYDRVASNFRSFCEINKKTGSRCEVTLKVTLYDRDLALGRRITQQWSGHVDRVRVTGLHNWGGTRGGKVPCVHRPPCPLIWHQVQILWDGQITLCCIDSMEGCMKLADASEVDLSDYWRRNPDLARIRREHEGGDLSGLPLCANCDMSLYSDLDIPG